MLVLSRKQGEAIIIDGKIRVVVVDINKQGHDEDIHTAVRLGITAPQNVRIDREEIHHLRERGTE